jgi:hypothetical protein
MNIVDPRKLLKDLLKADYLLADRGYDANWFREGLRRRETGDRTIYTFHGYPKIKPH